MMHFEGRDRAGPTLQDAEALVRSLVGVAAVRIIAAPDGTLREIVVVPESNASVRQVSRNVTSALMAGFGVDLDPESISIAGPPADNSEETDSPDRPALNRRPEGVRDAQTRRLEDAVSGPPAESAPAARNGAAGTNGTNGSGHKQNGAGHAGTARPSVSHGQPAEPMVPVRDPVRVHAPVRPRLELVEMGRSEGASRCRVVVASGIERFVGVGDGETGRTTEIELAGRVAVDALRAARTPRDPIQFEGAVLVDIAGRAHVVISLSIWTGADFETIAGAAPIHGSPAESAAQAVIDSIVAHLIA